MIMNKILLLLIIISGFLVIFYANSDIFSRKTILSVFQQHEETKKNTLSSENDINKYNNDYIRSESLIRNNINNYNNKNEFNSNLHHHNIRKNHTGHIKKVQYIPRQNSNESEYNIFVIYTKENYQLQKKFELFAKSLLKYTTIKVHLHIITDSKSEASAEELLKEQIQHYHKSIYYTLYDVHDSADKMNDIVNSMMPFFNSIPGSYYSDSLFYLSLGLYRIVNINMTYAILIDCDVVFRTDVRLLFDEFNKFSTDNLFGLAPELTPVYRHILYRYRADNPQTNFGNPYYSSAYLMFLNSGGAVGSSIGNNNNNNNNIGGINGNSINNQQQQQLLLQKHLKHKHIKHGYPGLNSGVVMFNFKRIRSSKLYLETLKEQYVRKLANKYSFKGHLGDQDFYTLLGYEFPSLIYRLDCIWNRQLCTWWKDHGYGDIFDTYFHCEGKIKLYHGNCNTRVPE